MKPVQKWAAALAVLCLNVVCGGAYAAIVLTITDNSLNETLNLRRDGTLVGNVNVAQELITYTDPLFPIHPPATAFTRVNLLEPGSNAVSDTLDMSLTPNSDAATSTLRLTFRSNIEGQALLGLTAPPAVGTATEVLAGNILVNLADPCPATGCRTQIGLLDGNNGVIDANSIGGPGLLVTVFSAPIPEPSAGWIVGAGMVLVGWLQLRRRRAAIA